MTEFRISGPGKYKTRNGRVVEVLERTGAQVYTWSSKENTYASNGRVWEFREFDNDLVARVHEPTPGSEWRLKDGRKAFVVGRSQTGTFWVVQIDNGTPFLADESCFTEPWVDPPRTWTRWLVVGCDSCGVVMFETREQAEAQTCRLSEIVEVTLPEKK